MSKRKISIVRLAMAFVVGLFLALGIKLLLHRTSPNEPQPVPAEAVASRLPEETSQIDLLAALDIQPDSLNDFLQNSHPQKGKKGYPLLATLQNAKGDYLADSVVKVVGNRGEELVQIGSSGMLVLSLDTTGLSRLTLVVPRGYTLFRQQSIPLGGAYQPSKKPDTSQLKYDVVWDREIQDTLHRELYRVQLIAGSPRGNQLRDQLRRQETALQLGTSASQELTPAEIFRHRKDSVVIVASLLPDGRITKGAGFVVDPQGIVATAFHVVDKPDALAQIIMTASGETYPITEVLAAGRSADVALVKTTGKDLAAAPLSQGDLEGEPVTLISHPQERFYTLTQGYICRYSSSVLFGEMVVRMTITAEFADGSSGAPVFNSRGEVTGLVSFTSGPGRQMVHRFATPVAEILRLLKPPTITANSTPSPPALAHR